MIHRTLVWSLSLACLFNGCQEPDHSLGSNPDIEHKVQSLLSRMTLAEKIGQMTQVNKDYLQDISDIKTYALGSILSGGGAVPAVNDPEHWADMVDSFQEQALATRLQIPLIYGIDAVHGHNNVVGATIFPHNIGLGCANDPDLVRQVARATAEEVAATGIHWTFSPCIAVPRDERWGRHYEGFSESPERVKALGAAAVEGYQGPSLEEATSILACAKHYVGDGGVVWGTGLNGKIDRGDTRLDENGIRRLHLPGYVSAIQSGVGSIMASYNSIQGQKMHGNRHYLTDILKGELGFEGFVVSDWAGIDEIPGDYRSDIKTAINAGIDMVMVPEHYQEFIQNLTDLVQTGEVPLERIDDAVTRILRIKYLLGLFDHPYTDRSLLPQVGSEAHRQVARQAVRESLVLLKNENQLLPLSKAGLKIHVAGANADDLGHQCGGWTITWQGGSGDITPGTTIYEAIRQSVDDPGLVTYSADGSGAAGSDVAVVVIGEGSYAEMEGDRDDLHLSAADQETLARVKQAGLPMVVILISGRPLIITDELPDWQACIAAWYPGTEGQGVADVLFGDYNPTGTLSVSWPRSMDQIPINVGDEPYDPLFPFGFGLRY